jgi:hypothetical protein
MPYNKARICGVWEGSSPALGLGNVNRRQLLPVVSIVTIINFYRSAYMAKIRSDQGKERRVVLLVLKRASPQLQSIPGPTKCKRHANCRQMQADI